MFDKKYASRKEIHEHYHKKYIYLISTIVSCCVLGGIGFSAFHYIKANHHSTVRMSLVHHSHSESTYINHQWLPMSVQSLNKQKLHLPKMNDKASIAIDADTGRILYQHNANQPRKVASLAKLMTIYLTEQKLAQDPNAWNKSLPISQNLQKISYNPELGGFKFKKGHRYTVRELFQAALIESSNNAAIALGQWVGGTSAHFVSLMNEQARAWHINARFVSISGLENNDLSKYHLIVRGNKDSANLVSAKAMAVISQHIIKDHPSTLNTTKIRSAKADGQSLTNLNQLLRPGSKVDGLKTGYTSEAGLCFVGTEKPSNKQDRIIVVMLHDPTDFKDANSLMQSLYATKQLNKH